MNSICEKGMEGQSEVEKKSEYEHEALLWLRNSLDPSPLRKVKAMRIWNAYQKKNGSKRLSRRGLYGVIRKVITEKKYEQEKPVFEKCYEGMIISNVVANINLEKDEMSENNKNRENTDILSNTDIVSKKEELE